MVLQITLVNRRYHFAGLLRSIGQSILREAQIGKHADDSSNESIPIAETRHTRGDTVPGTLGLGRAAQAFLDYAEATVSKTHYRI